MTALAPWVAALVLASAMAATILLFVLACCKPPTPPGTFRLKHLFQDRDLLEKTRTQLLIEGSLVLLSVIAVIVLTLTMYLGRENARPRRCSDYLLGPTTTSERLDPPLAAIGVQDERSSAYSRYRGETGSLNRAVHAHNPWETGALRQVSWVDRACRGLNRRPLQQSVIIEMKFQTSWKP